MKKNYKRVPFDIGLAKKIQSKEVEGRIVTSEDLLVRIVDFNFKDKTDSIVYIGTYANGEQEFIQTCDNEGKSFGVDVLFIELPEQTDNITMIDDWYKTEDVKEKIEFVASKIGITYEQFIIVMDSLKGIIKINGGMIQLLDDMKEDIERICETPKHEFKPFDKVLVRDNSEGKWVPDIFRYYDDNYPKDYPYRCCANDYKYCIPYEGNQELVGTTNKPKEK